MKIKRILIENFRGIENLEINLNGKNMLIEGKNGQGKTTIIDSFTWLMFGKISNCEVAKFEVQNINHKEEDSIVECEFEDGTVLKKINKLKVTKKRGTLEVIIDGNTNEYYINDVSKKMKEYNEFVNSIIDEKLFKILSNPMFFSTLDWKEKRSLIMGLVDVSGNEIDLKLMYDQISSLKASCTKINKKIDEISIRIKENKLKVIDIVVDTAKIETLEGQIKSLENEKNNQEKIIAEKNKELYIGLQKLQSERNEIEKFNNELKFKAMQKQRKELNINNLQEDLLTKNEAIKELESEIEDLNKEVLQKRIEYAKLADETFEMDENDRNCKSCGQKLPEDLELTKVIKFKTSFEKKKKEGLEKVRDIGQKINKNIENKSKKIQTLKDEIEKHNKEIEVLEAEKIEIGEELGFEEVDKLIDEINEKIKLSGSAEFNNNDTNILKEELKVEQQKQFEHKKQTEIKERILELEKEKKEQGKTFLEQQNKLNAIENIVKNTVDETVKNVTKLFPEEVTFKLFEEQKNGGIQETFDICYDGKPYELPISSGEKIWIGIEIIKVLQKKYEIELPIFIDNFEGLTKKINIENQLIMLKVNNCNLTIK